LSTCPRSLGCTILRNNSKEGDGLLVHIPNKGLLVLDIDKKLHILVLDIDRKLHVLIP